MPKPVYKTFVVERHRPEPRAATWARVVAATEQGLVAGEQVLSVEAPWRRVGRLVRPPLGLVEHTVAIRDDGDECHLVWAYVAEVPTADELAPEVDAALGALQADLTGWADAVAPA
jgi:hypothetical protein